MKFKTNFAKKVFEVVATIPEGKIMTYKEVAICADSPFACRAVGNILHSNTDPKTYPCHRVIKSDLTLASEYVFGGKEVQKQRLEEEGVEFIETNKGPKVKRNKNKNKKEE